MIRNGARSESLRVRQKSIRLVLLELFKPINLVRNKGPIKTIPLIEENLNSSPETFHSEPILHARAPNSLKDLHAYEHKLIETSGHPARIAITVKCKRSPIAKDAS